MIFIVLIVIGMIGVIGTIWMSSASLRYAQNPIPRGSEWFAMSPEKIESAVGMAVQTRFREVLKVILKWAIKHYRETTKNITVKQEIKKRVRAFLYEHRHDGTRNPSKMWGQLQNTQTTPTDTIAPDEIISSKSE